MRKSKALKLLTNGNGHFDDADLDAKFRMWSMKIDGVAEFDIAIQLGLPLHKVKKSLTQCRIDFGTTIQDGVENEKAVDVARLDILIKHYLAIALATKIPVIKEDAKGQIYTEDEWQYSQKAGDTVRALIAEKAKILGYAKAETPQANIQNNTNVWLSTNWAQTEKLLAGAKETVPTTEQQVIDIDFDSA